MPAWVVGDIHGCLAELDALEEEIRRVDDAPILVSVGDLVDRGPDSADVVERFRTRDDHHAIMGNHEDIMLRVICQERPDLLDGIDLPPWFETTEHVLGRKPRRLELASMDDWRVNGRLMWLVQGGAETLQSYGCDPAHPASWAFPREHLAWIAALPLLYEDDDQVVTHALVRAADLPKLRSGDPPRESAARSMWGRIPADDPPDPDRVHVSGHTVRGHVTRHPRRRLVQIDTGAYCGGRLSAYCAARDTTVSVASRVRWEMA